MKKAGSPAETRRLVAETVSHWRENLPRMTASLEAKGTLVKEATEAVDAALESLGRLMSQGLTWDQAWEMTREEHLFLPAEEEDEAEELPSEESYRAMKMMQGARRILDQTTEEESMPLVTTTKFRTSPTSEKVARK